MLINSPEELLLIWSYDISRRFVNFLGKNKYVIETDSKAVAESAA